MLLLRREVDWVTTYLSTGVWDNEPTPTNLWSDYANSDPIDDIESGKQTILQNTGREANTLVLAYPVWRQLKHHPDFVDRTKHVGKDVTTEMVASLLELERVLVAKAIRSTAAAYSTGATYDFVTGLDGLLCHVAPNPGLLTPSAGYNFIWKGISEGLGQTVAIRQIDLPLNKGTRVEGEQAWDQVAIASGLGYMFNNAVST
jgi:hypothetical protein